MKLDLSRNYEYWFDFDEDIAFKIRYLADGKLNELRAKCTERKSVDGKRVEEVNNEKLGELTFDHIVEDWKGIMDDGVEAPCTSENKLMLLKKYGRVFSAFIWEKTNDLKEIYSRQMEEEKKTSKIS